MVDVGILGTMKESVMFLPTVTGIERLALFSFSGAVTSIMIPFPAQAKGTPFHLFNKGSSFFYTSVFECFAGGQSCRPHTRPVLVDLASSQLFAEGTIFFRLYRDLLAGMRLM